MVTDDQIEAAANALDNLARIWNGSIFESHELREAAKAALVAAENWTLEKRLGDAINDALYKTPYEGALNVPCLGAEQRRAAARAAIAIMRNDR